jgi:Nucleotide modification associated domain 1
VNDPLITQLADQLGLKTAAGKAALEVALENIRTLDRKQQDYGSRNISDFGELGVLVRVNDKAQRIRNLIERGAAASNEPIIDSWLDLANYGIIGYLVATHRWPQ